MPKMSEVGWRVDTDSRGSKKRDGAVAHVCTVSLLKLHALGKLSCDYEV